MLVCCYPWFRVPWRVYLLWRTMSCLRSCMNIEWQARYTQVLHTVVCPNNPQRPPTTRAVTFMFRQSLPRVLHQIPKNEFCLDYLLHKCGLVFQHAECVAFLSIFHSSPSPAGSLANLATLLLNITSVPLTPFQIRTSRRPRLRRPPRTINFSFKL